jgi:hypothetical protein
MWSWSARGRHRRRIAASVTGTLGSEVIAAGEGVEPLFLVSGIPRGVQTLIGLLSAAHEFCHRCPHC